MNRESGTQDDKFRLMLGQIRELFFECGIKDLNMDDISHKLGISKKTLYRFVKNKEDLIARLLEYDQEKGVAAYRNIGEQNVNAIEKLFQVSLMLYEEMKRFNPVWFFELRKYYRHLFNEYHDKRMTHISMSMRMNLAQGKREGLYRDDINNEAVVALYINYLTEIHHSELCRIADVTFDELFRIMFENHIRAISTPAGVTYFENRKKEISQNLNRNNKQ